MDFYKKKPLKYSHEDVRREIRHTETLKARESSRFKRLSIIRDISQSDFGDESLETVKPVEEEKVQQVPLSRLELLRKWKEEKVLKKQLEAKSKIKPFYAGKKAISAGLENQNKAALKFSSNISFAASKFAESRFESSMKKPVSCMNKASTIPSFSKKNINAPGNSSNSTANQVNSAARSGNIGSRLPGLKSTFSGPVRSLKPAFSSQKPKQETALPKLACSKLPSKPLQKESALPKSVSSKLPSKPFQKASAPSVIQKSTTYGKVQSKTATSSVILKFTASGKLQPKTPTASVQKSTTSGKIQTKTPTSRIFQKSTPSGKIQSKEESQVQTKGIPLRKGFCFKKAAADARKQEAESKKILCTTSAKQESKEKLETKPNKEESSISEKLENIPDLTFDCDLSLIKPRQSFAPENFKFQPPSSLTDFMFDDDDDDPYAVLADFKVKYMSRTSTPTKKDRDRSSKESVSLPENTPCSNSEKDLNGSSLKDVQATTKDDPARSITREILENLSNMSCSMSPKLNSCSDIEKLEKLSLDNFNVNNDDSEENAYGNKKLGDCNDKHIQNTSDEHSEFSEKLCDDIVKNSNDKDSLKNEMEECCTETGEDGFTREIQENLETCDSPFDIVDVSKITHDWEEEALDSIKFDKEKLIETVELNEETEIPKGLRKSSRISCKRVSILKSISKLNVIDENLEDEHSNEGENSVFTPRRSVRLLHKHLDFIKDLPPDSAEEEQLISISPFTPRRSLRLQKALITSIDEKEESIFSPCKVKTPKYSIGTRRSMRLIDLNTPEKDNVEPDVSKSNLTADFQRLNLNGTENMDPSTLLIGVENSPATSSKFKSRKVSLLYSPVKGRKSIRKSIKGDLMSFSPSE